MVRRAIGDRLDTVVLFELPDVERVLREVAFWDVYYEHCSYFTLGLAGPPVPPHRLRRARPRAGLRRPVPADRGPPVGGHAARRCWPCPRRGRPRAAAQRRRQYRDEVGVPCASRGAPGSRRCGPGRQGRDLGRGLEGRGVPHDLGPARRDRVRRRHQPVQDRASSWPAPATRSSPRSSCVDYRPTSWWP